MTVRAVALDLDGTLLGPDDAVSAGNRRAVAAARDAGWHVILATARWYQLAERTARQLGLTDPVIACSGAEVRRLRDGVDLLDVRLPAAFASALYTVCDQDEGMTMVYQDSDVLLRAKVDPLVPNAPEARWVTSLADAEPTPRGAVIFGDALNALVLETLQPFWQHDVRFLTSVMSSGATALTLTGRQADKGVALRVACDDLGIATSEVVAFGDSETDVEMFRVAGASVAMGQSAGVVKDAATWVTASNADDGVARSLEMLLEGHEAAV
jgi:Cof subfamily protein (haloacid dehalogenase superfamily)